MLKWVLIAVALAATLVGYQNCATEDAFSGFGDGGSSAPAPFAFGATVDHLAFMSCHTMDTPYNDREFFTFKVKAVDDSSSGFYLTETFLTKTANQSAQQRASRIKNDSTQKVVLQLAVRSVSDPENGVFGIPAERPVYNDILSALTDRPFIDDIPALKEDQYVTYPDFYGRLNFGQGAPGELQNLRQTLANGGGLLSLTFHAPKDALKAKTSEDGVYGLGLQIGFTCPDLPTCKAQILNEIRTFDLNGNRPTLDNWDCPIGYRYKIVRFGDTPAGCNFTPNPASPGYQVAQRILGANWDIDGSGLCVRPKQASYGSCYGSRGAARNVAYDLSTPCDGATQPACVQYLSICLKDG